MTEPSYALRVSVQTTNKKPIDGLESSRSIKAVGRNVNVKADGDHLIFTAGDFASAAEAEEFWPRLRGGLWNLALEQNVAFIPYFDRRNIVFAEDPAEAARNLARAFGMNPDEPVHGMTQEGGWTIIRSDWNIKFLAASAGSLFASANWANAADALAFGIKNVRSGIDEADRNLAVALDLYMASFRENSTRARFLTIVMALEVLAPVTQRHALAVALLKDMYERIDIQLGSTTDRDAVDALEALRRDIDFRKETSIRRRVRNLVLEEASIPAAERAILAKDVVAAYDLRGSMVHSGVCDEGALVKALDSALRAAKLVLRARLGLAA